MDIDKHLLLINEIHMATSTHHRQDHPTVILREDQQLINANCISIVQVRDERKENPVHQCD